VEEVSIKWIRNILYALISVFILAILFRAATTFIPDLTYISAWWVYLAWAIITFYISIAGYNDNSHLNTSIQYNEAITIDNNVDNKIEDDLPIIDLKEIAFKEKSYLKPNLNLNDYAKQAGIASAQVSKILNSKYNQNFNEFVNTFRIEEVKAKLNDPNYSHYSILGIALECGFNSKATFNRVFKNITGQSPSAYKKSQIPK
jgi:AraC-like DNA-binding protein